MKPTIQLMAAAPADLLPLVAGVGGLILVIAVALLVARARKKPAIPAGFEPAPRRLADASRSAEIAAAKPPAPATATTAAPAEASRSAEITAAREEARAKITTPAPVQAPPAAQPAPPQAPALKAASLDAPGPSVNSFIFALSGVRPDAPTRSAYDDAPAKPARPPLPTAEDGADSAPLLAMPANMAALPSPAQDAYTPSFNSLLFNLGDVDPSKKLAAPAPAPTPTQASAPKPPAMTVVDSFEVPEDELGGLGLSFDSLAFGLQEGAPSEPPVQRPAAKNARPPEVVAAPAPLLSDPSDFFGGMGGGLVMPAMSAEEPRTPAELPSAKAAAAPQPRLLGGIASMMSPFGAGEPDDEPGRFDVEGVAPDLKLADLSDMFGMLPDAPPRADRATDLPSSAADLQSMMTGTMMGDPARALAAPQTPAPQASTAPRAEETRPRASTPRAAMGVLRRGKASADEEPLADEPTSAGDAAYAAREAFIRMPTRPAIPNPTSGPGARPPEQRQMTPLRSVPNKVMRLSMRSSRHGGVPTTSEDEIMRLYREFLQALKACGQQGGALMSFDVFREKIRIRRDKVRQKHGIYALSMEILIKDGRPLIEIRPRG
jgi:hypothetical protein